MIRHALLSSTVPTTTLGVHGTPTQSCLIATPSFSLQLVADVFRARSGAVDLAPIASPTDKNLTAAARTQKHSARRLIDTCRGVCPTRRVPALYACTLRQHSALRPLARLSGRTAGIRNDGIPHLGHRSLVRGWLGGEPL
jgi:hypothetical protein